MNPEELEDLDRWRRRLCPALQTEEDKMQAAGALKASESDPPHGPERTVLLKQLDEMFVRIGTQAAGGRVTEKEVVIPVQAPVAPPLEQWDADPPIRRLEFDDPAWEWRGDWAPGVFVRPWAEWKVKETSAAGAEAALRFEGTGVAIVGGMTQEGGRADVYIDGERSDLPLDAWIPERTFDNVLWHRTGLEPGEHDIRIVVSGDADERSRGELIQIQFAVVYGTRAE